MFRLKYCGDINSGVCAKSSIQIRCFFIGIQWSYRVGAAVRDPEMQPYRSEPRWPSPSINKTGSHVSVCPNLNLHLILSEDQIKSVFRLLKTASRLSALLMGIPQCNAQRKLRSWCKNIKSFPGFNFKNRAKKLFCLVSNKFNYLHKAMIKKHRLCIQGNPAISAMNKGTRQINVTAQGLHPCIVMLSCQVLLWKTLH